MRITGPESEFMDGFATAAKDDAAEFRRLDARIADLEMALLRLAEALEKGEDGLRVACRARVVLGPDKN